jgi:hypothetical protein
MEGYERKFDKAANRAAGALGSVERGITHLANGCMLAAANLFFAAFCLWGAYAAYASYRLEANGQTTPGRVIRLEESSSTDGGCCVYSPVVEFQVKEQTYVFESDSASYPPAYEVGESVEVLYDPADPNKAQINKFGERWFFPMIIIPSMIFTAMLVNVVAFRAWRRGESIAD